MRHAPADEVGEAQRRTVGPRFGSEDGLAHVRRVLAAPVRRSAPACGGGRRSNRVRGGGHGTKRWRRASALARSLPDRGCLRRRVPRRNGLRSGTGSRGRLTDGLVCSRSSTQPDRDEPPLFDYRSPSSLDEALALRSEYAYDSVVLAGGQSLMPMLNLRLARPEVLIDLGRVAELTEISELDGALPRRLLASEAPSVPS